MSNLPAGRPWRRPRRLPRASLARWPAVVAAALGATGFGTTLIDRWRRRAVVVAALGAAGLGMTLIDRRRWRAVVAAALGAAGLIVGMVLTGALAASAQAKQIATIDARFSPERLGAHTTLSLGYRVRTDDGTLPSALTGLEFHYPPQLGIGTSDLGLASCDPAKLAFYGPGACPPNSIMGTGSALVQFQVSPQISEETASIGLVAGPSPSGYVDILIAATGTYPVSARIVMSALLLPGRLQFSIPLVPGIPEGPDVAVVSFHIVIGGHLTYYELRKGRRVPYHPQGILLPRRCPRGGFRFSATSSFLDGTQSQAQTTVKCPR